ncbi:MAG: hypothetical protein ABJO29_02340 [Yoonia sp.]|uniref:hypothetical protein n=1 Tax=Yoonia sp. TaxID=2212373 RepID=UPI003264D547
MAILSVLIGGLGVSTFLGVSTSSLAKFGEAIFGKGGVLGGCEDLNLSLRLLFISIAFLIASIGVYSAAMRQITVFNRFELLDRPLLEWEIFVFREIRKLEIEIAVAGYLFGAATFLIFLAVLFPNISCA